MISDCHARCNVIHIHAQDNVRAAWPVIWDLAGSPRGRRALTQAFRLCDELGDKEEEVWGLAYWIQSKRIKNDSVDLRASSTYLILRTTQKLPNKQTPSATWPWATTPTPRRTS